MSQAAISDGETASPAGVVSHPPCPSCGEGVLIPMNSLTFWVCTTPACTYVISAYGASVTYYKGHALTEREEKSGKRWVKFNF